MAKQIRVSPSKTSDGHKRVVKQTDNDRASARTYTKSEAIQTASQIARSQWLEVKIQNRDGRISESNSFGNDPKNIKW